MSLKFTYKRYLHPLQGKLRSARGAELEVKSRLHRHRFLQSTELSESIASKLHQLKLKASLASQFLCKHGNEYYKTLLEKNKQYIQDPPTVEKCNELSKQLFYTRLSSLPSRTESFRKEYDYVKQLCKNKKDLKVEDAAIAAVFGHEVFAWYCVGEIVGRGFTFTDYYP